MCVTMGRALAAAMVVLVALAAGGRAARADDPGLLALGVGAYDFIGNGDEPAALFRGEYRFSQGLFFIKPIVGAQVASDGSFYGYGGVRADLVLAQHFVIMPFGTVGYWTRGDGRDMGDHAEFSEGAELAYRFDTGARLGVSMDHMSNAGLSERNPGAESALLVYSLPLGLPF